MRRTPIVITATVAGLIGVLEFHTRPAPVNIVTIPAAGSAAASPAATGSAASSPAATGPSRGSARSRPSGQPGSARTAVGPAVNYDYGVLSVAVTVSGTRITKVGIASLDDGGNPRSQMIDQQAIPILEQEALQVQSASIQGVSGASYTSAGFAQSLQAALRQLGVR
ncbi:MAG TPA: FMN-binding protein [Streptosporangiaceae bacterium]|nr:FMN-binding protein [Streptosporangiaceae bacterium]